MIELRSANFDMEVMFEGEMYYVLCTTYPDGSSVWGTVPTNTALVELLQSAEVNIDVNVKLPKQIHKKGDRPEPPNSFAVSSAKRRRKPTV